METAVTETSELKLPQPGKPRHKMPLRTKLLFYLVAWLIVLMPFLFWRSTWFGRRLSESDITTYLHDNSKPRHIQHAVVQIGERMGRGDQSARQWYPDLVRLASYPVEEVRNTDAWVMGQDNTNEQFHRALLKMLDDASPTVRSNAALSLVRFGDASGRPQIVAMLQPVTVTAPRDGTVEAVARAGEPANHGTVLVKLGAGSEITEVRAPITGRIRSITVQPGASVRQGASLATLDPGAEQVWEALRALYLVGTLEDLPAIRPYQRDTPEYPQRIVQQATETERAILARAGK